MRTRASIAGHPIHVMAVTLPIGLWIFSLVCDAILLAGRNPDLWFTVGYITMAGGIVGALVAAVFGAIDLFALPKGHARSIGVVHMTINLAIVALYGLNLWMRTGELDSMAIPFTLSVAAIVALGVSGWLGGELVHIHMVGVDPDEATRRADRPLQGTPVAHPPRKAGSHT
ncbi:MAG TPA: DUF2231 domain-containing protein [Casimicrobiaceae bacterium]|nr:DUF2231 domain-containing protein [Casimicrobiaceae bacterium]